VFLYIKYDEFVRVLVASFMNQYSWLHQDNAALAMIERSADAWEHNQFKDVIVRAANVEMCVPLHLMMPLLAESLFRYYKALTFYLQEQPMLLTDLLTVLIPRIDHGRVVRMFRQIDHIPLIRAYLIAVQHVGCYVFIFSCKS
jgi:clathrin heavy chain